MDHQISYLADRPEFIPALAAGTLAEWAYLWPARSLEWRIARLRAHLNREELPIAWVMHEGATVMGTAALRPKDLDGMEHLTPWLGGVFVFPEFRGRGIGAALCDTVEREASLRGVEELYLGTFDNQQWYASMGWNRLSMLTVQGRQCDIMSKTLPAHAGD